MKKHAFTLVELLVVIAIIGVLVGLLLPAVQAAREAARRMQCSNHMKQISIAAHNYHDTFHVFPPGAFWRGDGNAASVQYWRATWGISLLPFIEQESLFSLYDPGYAIGNTANSSNRTIAQTQISTYTCPSDAEPGKLIVPAAGWLLSATDTYEQATASYVAIGGAMLGNSIWCTGGSPNSPWKNWNGIYPAVGQFGSGTGIYRLSQTPIAAVTDGTSHTIAFAEHHQPDTAPGRSAFWASIGGNTIASITASQTSLINHHWDKCIAGAPSTVTNTNLYCSRSTGAYHPGGFNIALADASVRFLANTINLEVWRNSATMQNGEMDQL